MVQFASTVQIRSALILVCQRVLSLVRSVSLSPQLVTASVTASFVGKSGDLIVFATSS